MKKHETPRLDDTMVQASMERLADAGVIATVVHDAATGGGILNFTPAYHRLLMAGRNPTSEQGFRDAWLTGDPRKVRAWIESEAASLPDRSPDNATGRGGR